MTTEERLDRLERIVAIGFSPPEVLDPEVQGVWRDILALREQHGIDPAFYPEEQL